VLCSLCDLFDGRLHRREQDLHGAQRSDLLGRCLRDLWCPGRCVLRAQHLRSLHGTQHGLPARRDDKRNLRSLRRCDRALLWSFALQHWDRNLQRRRHLPVLDDGDLDLRGVRLRRKGVLHRLDLLKREPGLQDQHRIAHGDVPSLRWSPSTVLCGQQVRHWQLHSQRAVRWNLSVGKHSARAIEAEVALVKIRDQRLKVREHGARADILAGRFVDHGSPIAGRPEGKDSL